MSPSTHSRWRYPRSVRSSKCSSGIAAVRMAGRRGMTIPPSVPVGQTSRSTVGVALIVSQHHWLLGPRAWVETTVRTAHDLAAGEIHEANHGLRGVHLSRPSGIGWHPSVLLWG